MKTTTQTPVQVISLSPKFLSNLSLSFSQVVMYLAVFVPNQQIPNAQVVIQDITYNLLLPSALPPALMASMKSQQIALVLHVIHHAQLVQENQILNAQPVAPVSSYSLPPPLARQLALPDSMETQQPANVLNAIHHAQVVTEDRILNAQAVTLDSSYNLTQPHALLPALL